MWLPGEGLGPHGSWPQFFRPDHCLPRMQGTIRRGDAVKDSRREAGKPGWVAPPQIAGAAASPDRAAYLPVGPQSPALHGLAADEVARVQTTVSGLPMAQGPALDGVRQVPPLRCASGKRCPALSHLGLIKSSYGTITLKRSRWIERVAGKWPMSSPSS